MIVYVYVLILSSPPLIHRPNLIPGPDLIPGLTLFSGPTLFPAFRNHRINTDSEIVELTMIYIKQSLSVVTISCYVSLVCWGFV